MPKWSVGTRGVTFRHVYVIGVVELKGYMSKWIPLLEVEEKALQ